MIAPNPPSGLRILMTVDAAGGVWRYAMDLASGLSLLGHRIVFAGFGPAPDATQRQEAEALGVLEWSDAPLEWMVQRPEELREVPKVIADLAARHRIDLLQLNLPSQAAGLETDKPILVVSHSCVRTWFDAVRDSDLPEGWAWQAEMTRAGFDRAAAVVTPSRAHGAALRRCYGPIANLRCVHNGSDTPPGPRQPEELIVAVGRWWDEGKGAATLDAVAQALEWPVHMAGPLKGPAGAEAVIVHANAPGALSHSHTQALIGRAGIFVSPSLYEPFGLAVLEAARGGSARPVGHPHLPRALGQGRHLLRARRHRLAPSGASAGQRQPGSAGAAGRAGPRARRAIWA
jgi:hypothetical protein